MFFSNFIYIQTMKTEIKYSFHTLIIIYHNLRSFSLGFKFFKMLSKHEIFQCKTDIQNEIMKYNFSREIVLKKTSIYWASMENFSFQVLQNEGVLAMKCNNMIRALPNMIKFTMFFVVFNSRIPFQNCTMNPKIIIHGVFFKNLFNFFLKKLFLIIHLLPHFLNFNNRFILIWI